MIQHLYIFSPPWPLHCDSGTAFLFLGLLTHTEVNSYCSNTNCDPRFKLTIGFKIPLEEQWDGHTTRVGERRYAYKVLVG